MDNLQIFIPNQDWNAQSDADIWKAIKNDNINAFAFIYNKHVKALYNYGMKIHYDDFFISETIQELFIDCWQHRHNQSNVQNIKVYLFKSLRYKIFREIGKRKNFSFLSVEKFSSDISIVAPYEEDLINIEDNDDRRIKIASKINQLPERQREVINLLFYENYSYEEIAIIMSINLRSVYTLTWKAISNLKNLITKLIISLPFFFDFLF
jgi:RNA polymerase sigma factor (sigma-70 family)